MTALLTAFSFSILSRLDRLFYRPARARAVRPSPRRGLVTYSVCAGWGSSSPPSARPGLTSFPKSAPLASLRYSNSPFQSGSVHRFLCRFSHRVVYRSLSRFRCRLPGRYRCRHVSRFLYRLLDRSIDRSLGRFLCRLPDRFLGCLLDRFLSRLLDRSACRLLGRASYHSPTGFWLGPFSLRLRLPRYSGPTSFLHRAPPRLPTIGFRDPGSRTSALGTRAPRVLPPPSGTSRHMEIRRFHHRLTEVPSVDMLIEA